MYNYRGYIILSEYEHFSVILGDGNRYSSESLVEMCDFLDNL